MMTAWLLALGLLGADANHWVGTLRVVGPAQTPAVMLRIDNRDVSLVGEIVPELQHLAAAKVDVAGAMNAGGQLELSGYTLLAISNLPAPPRVGELIQADGALALQEPGAAPLPLQLNKASRTRLLAAIGGKVWVAGSVADGRLEVQAFGVLRLPRQQAPASAPSPAPSPTSRLP